MRLRFLKNIIILSFIVLTFCLWYIQCMQNPRYSQLSYKNRIRLISLPGPRGNIYDRNKNILAGSRLAFDCAVIPQEFKVDGGKIAELSSILKMKSGILKMRIKEEAVAPFISVVLKKDIGKETAIDISERSMDYPGLIIQTHPVRYYPNDNIGSHVTGYLGKINEEEINALRDYGYKAIDYVGRSGLELYYDNYLKGEDGGVQTEVDSRGRELRVLGIREPEKGRDITLTIDLELERYIDSLLAEHKGACIVMNSDSGEILGFVSRPDFDPNLFVATEDPALIKDLLKRRDYPLVNRAISGAYPPGSVFKIVTASAALELEKIGPEERLNCKGFYMLGGRRFSCWKKSGHGLQTIRDGIKNSCNVFFYQIGRRVGVDDITKYASRYGFGRTTEIDLPYEAEGAVPTRAWKKRYKRESWYEGDTVNYSIGQGYLLVTPIQILQMVNAVAKEGEVVKPFLVKNIDTVEVFSPEKSRVDISNDTFKVVKEGMRRAVEEAKGTARNAGVKGMRIAGKTGTAEAGRKGTHAWFAGFSPIEKPKISLVVFLEYGGKGGNKSSKIASNIFKKLKELNYL